jgi:hypothetical protein
MTEDQLETWMHNMIRACNRSTCDSDINAIKLSQHIKTIYEQGRTDEREACAKLCESMGVHPALNVWGGGPEWYKRQKECAKAIRARGEK